MLILPFELTKKDTPETFVKKFVEMAEKLFIGNFKTGMWEIEIRKPKRTNLQNDRYWKMIIESFSNWTGYDKQETHQLLAKKFLAYEKKGKSGKVQLFVKSTTQLNTKEFCEYCDQCERFGNEHGLIFPSLRE